VAKDKGKVEEFTIRRVVKPPEDEIYFGFWSVLLLTVFLTVVSLAVLWVISALVVVFFLFFKKYRALSMVSGALWLIIFLLIQGF